jgi:hypothetical protein
MIFSLRHALKAMKAKCIAVVLGRHFNIRAEQRVFF